MNNNNDNDNDNNKINKSLPPPIISNPSDTTTNASNELPTPPSVPLSDPAPFPSNNNNNNNNNTNTNNHTHRPPPQPHLRPQQRQQRQRPPPPAITSLPNNHNYIAPPAHYNKYYPYRYGTNPMYNSYPIPHHHYTTYAYPQHPVRPVAPSFQYPTFNGITPKLQTQQTPQPPHAHAPNTINYPHAPPPHAPPPPPPKPAQISSKSSPKSSPNISINSTPKSTPKKMGNPPKINPTFRPFYESENEQDIKEDKNDIDIKNNQSDDSDYDPSNSHDTGKKKGKKKKKKKKKSMKKSKKKKKSTSTGKILQLASQKIYVTNPECKKSTKALKWREFREWLKYNLEPYDHQHSIKKKQRQLFTHKMNKLLQFCTYNEITNHGDTQHFYSLWLQIPQKEKWIQLLINDGNWFTNCTSEQQMMGYTTEISQRDYYFFRVLEGHTTPNNIILLIRCDKGGNCGELVWLQKGQNVSGTDALAIENALSSALDLRWVYLHDDSKIKYGGNTSRSQCNLYLKTIRSIAKGQSWYSQAFYRPFNCTNWPSQTNINGKTQTGVEPGTVFTQNAKEYKNSVNLIRGFKINKLRKLLIDNTDFNKQGEKNKNKNKHKCGEDDENDGGDIYPVMHPSDLKKFDEVLTSMNEYDPYFEIHGTPARLKLEKQGVLVNPGYFFNFSEDEIDIDMDSDNVGDEDGDICMTKLTPLRRQTRSRSKRDAMDDKKEKLQVNNKICVVSRWHKRRIKVKHSIEVVNSEYIGESGVEYRRQCRSVGELAAVLYHEGNPESWGQNKNYGLKLVRGAKENLIKFFQHILTSAESKEIKHLTPQFKMFHKALKSIEETKIFGKRSKRWALKMNKMQKMQEQQRGYGHGVNSKDNPIHILSQSQSQSPSKLNKLNKNRHKSTEPLMNIAMERQHQMNYDMYYNNNRRYYGSYAPHWSFRGYPSAMNRPPHHAPSMANGYFTGFNRELRNELAGDAQKLKIKQMQEKRKLDDHKTFLKNDLDSHLTPNINLNTNTSMSVNSNKHKLLFESLKGPSNIVAKKTVQPPLRVHRNLVDSISHSHTHVHTKINNNNNNNNNNDTDSTLSTINNDSDSTINNVNINICETVNNNSVNSNEISIEKEARKAANANKTNMDVIILDCDNDNINIKKTHMTRAQTRKNHKKQICGNKRHSSVSIKPPPNKRIKLDSIQIPNNLSRDELIEEIKKYDTSFCFGKKWCRYCGCKASNCWNVRNRMILCETHDIEYENNKLFRQKIDGYKKIPRKPIDANKNTECKYLKNKLMLELSKQKNI